MFDHVFANKEDKANFLRDLIINYSNNSLNVIQYLKDIPTFPEEKLDNIIEGFSLAMTINSKEFMEHLLANNSDLMKKHHGDIQ